MINRVSDIDFLLDVKVKISNVERAFEVYKNRTLQVYEGNLNAEDEKIFLNNREKYEKNFISFIKEAVSLNKDKGVVFDFYTDRLDKESIFKIKENLSKEESNDFDMLIELTNLDGKYFKLLDDKLIPILVKLNTRELFFVTFYFLDDDVTIWGNYNMKFPVFYIGADENFDKYSILARENKLFL